MELTPGRGAGVRTAGLVIVGAVALARADAGLVAALAPVLRTDLHLDDARLGLLASLASVTGAISALPAGHLVDTRNRRALLTVALIAWSAALGVAGLATGILLLGVARMVSGAVSTVARPSAVSMIGERYPPAERGRALARLDAGQTAGAAASFLVAAVAVAIGSWRLAFFALALAGVVLASLARGLPTAKAGAGRSGPGGLALRTLLRIRTNVLVLAADSVGNFFFAGATSFTVLLVTERFGLSTAVVDALAPLVGLAVIAGVLLGGRIGDRVAARTDGSRRLVVACVALLAAAAIFLPALLTRSLLLAGPVMLLGAGVLGVSGPCLDTVRVDVVAPALRGRSEAARGLITLASSALGPVTFGLLANALGGRNGDGLAKAFMIMLVPLAASGLVLLLAVPHYRPDAERAGTITAGRV